MNNEDRRGAEGGALKSKLLKGSALVNEPEVNIE